MVGTVGGRVTPGGRPEPGVWAQGRAPATVGILLLISITAFEGMGVTTAMPDIVDDLGGVTLYAWPMVLFLAASVFATAAGGRWCDRHGPRVPLVAAPIVFGIGLLVAGAATAMPQLLAGRVLQGLGAGVGGVAVYVLVAAVYPVRLRPVVFGLISSAWILPSLAGPPLAALLTERFSWHWVFLGLLPLTALAVVLVLPVARGLGRPTPGPATRGTVLAATGAALGVAGLSWALERRDGTGAAVGLLALAVLVPAFGRLLPAGTMRARPGIASVVAARGLIAGAFTTVGTYLPLVLTATHDWTLTAAATPLIVASLGWSASAAWQARRPGADRSVLMRAGFTALAAGQLGLVPVAAGWWPGWVAIVSWGLAGLAMGIGYSAIAYLTLAHSGPDDVGGNSSAAQLLDQLAQASFIGLGGALLATLISPAVAMPVLLLVVSGLSVTGALVAGRTRVPAAPSA